MKVEFCSMFYEIKGGCGMVVLGLGLGRDDCLLREEGLWLIS